MEWFSKPIVIMLIIIVLLIYCLVSSLNSEEEMRKVIKEKEITISDLNIQILKLQKKISEIQHSYLEMEHSIQDEFENSLPDTLNGKFNYVASLMGDFLTLKIKDAEIDLERSPKYHERKRALKVQEIRMETARLLAQYKESQYQLDYLIQMYPELNDVIINNMSNAPSVQEIKSNLEKFNEDPVSGYISRSEWNQLTPTERNQLALNRYLESHKSNWQIGRDYELYIAYVYERKGYSVDTFGSYMRINDLGRDLIAKKGNEIEVVQCKYWSEKKEIHENHICQLFGTVICYCIENNLSVDDVKAVFVTSTTLSKKAKEFSEMLNIKVLENIPLKDFPRIKCNIGHDEFGKQTYIYHLPMDDLYDKVKISKKGERYCNTVREAESLGFRRAYKWHGN